MKMNLILSVTVLVIASAARVSADPFFPVRRATQVNPMMLKVNPNPVIVPAGQTQGTTTLTWNTRGAEGYVWVSVDGGEETQLNEAGIAEGTLGATAEVGKSYAFKLYTADKEQLLASVTVSVVVQQPVPPAPPPAPKTRPGRVRGRGPVNNGSDFQMICRGGPGLRFSVTPAFLFSAAFMSISFNRSTQPPDPSGRNLQPSQCTPADFPLSSFDPTRIQCGLAIWPLPDEFSHYVLEIDSDVRIRNYIAYLKDPNHYWSFGLYDTSAGYFQATDGKYWKPESYKPNPILLPADSEIKERSDLVFFPTTPPEKGLGRLGNHTPVIDVNPLAAKGEAIANADPLAVELRNRQPEGPSRRGFDIGMAAAEGQTLPGPGKQRIHDSLSPAERGGFDTAVSFSLERNRNADLAATGTAIADQDPIVVETRNLETDVFYRLGFDIATGIFGDPALGAKGNTATGPGSLGIRDSLSAAGQRGFNASVKLHLSRNYKP